MGPGANSQFDQTGQTYWQYQKIHNLIVVNWQVTIHNQIMVNHWQFHKTPAQFLSLQIVVNIMITTHKVVTNKKQGPGRGHPWSSDRNRAEFPVSAWEVKLKTMKLQKEIGWSCFKNEFHQKYDIDCRKSITTNALFWLASCFVKKETFIYISTITTITGAPGPQ